MRSERHAETLEREKEKLVFVQNAESKTCGIEKARQKTLRDIYEKSAVKMDSHHWCDPLKVPFHKIMLVSDIHV